MRPKWFLLSVVAAAMASPACTSPEERARRAREAALAALDGGDPEAALRRLAECSTPECRAVEREASAAARATFLSQPVTAERVRTYLAHTTRLFGDKAEPTRTACALLETIDQLEVALIDGVKVPADVMGALDPALAALSPGFPAIKHTTRARLTPQEVLMEEMAKRTQALSGAQAGRDETCMTLTSAISEERFCSSGREGDEVVGFAEGTLKAGTFHRCVELEAAWEVLRTEKIDGTTAVQISRGALPYERPTATVPGERARLGLYVGLLRARADRLRAWLTQPASAVDAAVTKAIVQGDRFGVVAWLNAHPDRLNLPQGDHEPTALAIAVLLREDGIATLLLGRGADLNAGGSMSPLHVLAGDDAPDTVQQLDKLVARGARLDVTGDAGETVLHTAAMSGNVEVVSWGVSKGLALGATDADGLTPLHAALLGEQPEAVARALVAAGANVNAVTKDGHTPLRFAVERGHNSAAAFLKERGAKLGPTPRKQAPPPEPR